MFVRAVHSFYSRRARAAGRRGGRCGSIVYVQRFSSDRRLDVHYHAIVLDGVYTGFDSSGSSLRFHPAKQLTDDEVTWLVEHIAALVTYVAAVTLTKIYPWPTSQGKTWTRKRLTTRRRCRVSFPSVPKQVASPCCLEISSRRLLLRVRRGGSAQTLTATRYMQLSA